jgi:hypothetical protein
VVASRTMPDLEEIVDDFVERLAAAGDKPRAVQRLLAELNGMRRLSHEDRLYVFDEVCKRVAPRRTPAGIYVPQPSAGDNARTLDLIRALRGNVR